MRFLRHDRRVMLPLVLLAALYGAWTAPAAADSSPFAQMSSSVSATVPGAMVTLTGTGFQANEVVTVAFDFQPITSVLTLADGSVPPVAIRIPYNAVSATHALSMQGGLSGRVAFAEIFVGHLQPHIYLNDTDFDPGRVTCVHGSGYANTEPVGVSVNGTAVVTATADVNGSLVICFGMPAAIGSADNILTATGVQSGVAASVHFTGVLSLSNTTYLAGGSNAGGADTHLLLFDNSPFSTRVAVTVYSRTRDPVQRTLTLGAHASTVLDLAPLAGSADVIGARVQSEQFVLAQFVVHRAGKAAYTVAASGAPDETWYLADGYTGATFHERVQVVNPGNAPTTVTLKAISSNAGDRARTASIVVQPGRTGSFDIDKLIANRAVSIVATSDQPVLIARVMVFGPHGYGATGAPGIAQGQRSWTFPAAPVANGARTYLSAYNPAARQTATLSVDGYDTGGRHIFAYTTYIAARHRTTVALHDLVANYPILQGMTFYLSVQSSVAIALERTIYDGDPNYGRVTGTVAAGPTAAATSWAFPSSDINAGGREYLNLASPNGLPVTAQETVYLADGSARTFNIYVPGFGMSTIDVAAQVARAATAPYEVQIASSSTSTPFVAEVNSSQ